MNISKLVGRAKRIVLSPRTEWSAIAGEETSIKGIYLPYVLVLAALPAVAGFVRNSLIGHAAFGIHVRVPVMPGLVSMVIGYVLSLVLVYVVALIIDALAPHFDGHSNRLRALKTIAYAWTAVWVAGIAVIVPWLGWLIALLGGVYSIYLLYVGLPHTMQCPQEKAGVYTLVTVVIAVVLSWIMSLMVAGIVGMGMLGGATVSGPGSHGGAGDTGVTFDKDSRLGALMSMGKRMQAASEAREPSQGNSTDTQAKSAGVRKAYTAMLTGRADGKPVKSMAPGKLKSFLPESLGGWQRKSLSAKRQGGMGMQITTAEAKYANGKIRRELIVTLTDAPALGGIMRMAGAFGVEMDSQSDHGFEKKYVRDGQRIHEVWNSEGHFGEYSVSFGDHYQAHVKGRAESMDELKQVMAKLDLEGLASAGKD